MQSALSFHSIYIAVETFKCMAVKQNSQVISKLTFIIIGLVYVSMMVNGTCFRSVDYVLKT